VDPSTAPPAAQPQGDGSATVQPQGQMPWDLNAHPEELRPYLADELKKVEGSITQRFQEAAEFRKRAEPLLPLLDVDGVADIPAEDMQGLVEFYATAQDPQQFEEWWTNVGEELGFFADDTSEETGAEDDEPPAWAQSLMQRLDSLEGGVQEFQGTQREQQALAQIEGEIAEIREQNPDLPWDDPNANVEDDICSLAMAYGDDPDAISKGFADYQRITGHAQGRLVDQTERQPQNALSGGGGDTRPEDVKGFDDAKKIARTRFASGAR
jgi:hypothetical protein